MITPLHELPSDELAVKAREHVFRAGDAAHHVYGIAEGRVVMTRFTEEGNSVVVADVTEGQWIAEASIFERRYHCDAVAVSDASLRRVRCEDVRDAVRTNPDFALRYVEYLSRRIVNLREQLEIRTIIPAGDRILRFLRARAVDNVFAVPGSYKNLAAQLGLTHETLYRKLSELEADGLIERSYREITLR